MVRVKLVTAPPGGMYDGFSDAVAPTGVPCTASTIGPGIAVPCIITEKLKVAALPAGTLCAVAPVGVRLKSDVVPTTIAEETEVLGRKFESHE
jgi:hypothetical protein